MKECPFCESTDGFFVKVTQTQKTWYDFQGNLMYVENTNTHNFEQIYCADCERIIGNIEKEYKDLSNE